MNDKNEKLAEKQEKEKLEKAKEEVEKTPEKEEEVEEVQLNEEHIKEIKENVEDKEVKNLIEKLCNERDEYNNKYLRALANYENLRKRARKENQESYNFAVKKVFRDVLPVLDDFERGYKSIKENPSEEEKDNFIDGMRLIHSKLKGILKNYQIEPFESKGKKFDPKKHEAIHVIEDEDAEEGTILEEAEQGYKINDDILRPAKVVVAEEKEEKEEKDEEVREEVDAENQEIKEEQNNNKEEE